MYCIYKILYKHLPISATCFWKQSLNKYLNLSNKKALFFSQKGSTESQLTWTPKSRANSWFQCHVSLVQLMFVPILDGSFCFKKSLPKYPKIHGKKREKHHWKRSIQSTVELKTTSCSAATTVRICCTWTTQALKEWSCCHNCRLSLGVGINHVHKHPTYYHIFKGQLGVPLTVYPWYLLCFLGILGDYNP